ncbi:MAG: hypothetical protein GKR89_14930 [Candidatus Latescibacteria bacterium]|nr:hypothetical protein [Candidatus Latescibacterota bacterium]
MPSRPPLTRFLAHAALLLGGLSASLLLVEGAVRLIEPSDNVRITASIDIFAPHPRRGFTLRPMAQRSTYWNGDLIHILVNDRGRRIPRDPDFVELQGREQWVFCGDSFTFGNEINAADAFVYQLRRRIDRDTVNLGIAGYSTFQALDALREFVAGPDAGTIERVVLVFFLGNDFLDNTQPKERTGVDAQGRQQVARHGPTETLRGLVYKSRALSFIVLRSRTLYLNAKYWITGSIYPHLYSEAFYTPELIGATRQALDQFKTYCATQGLDLTIVALPDKDQVYRGFVDEGQRLRPTQTLTALLDELSIDYLDMLPVFRAAQEGPLFNMTPAGHLSVRGHQLVAQTLAQHLAPR